MNERALADLRGLAERDGELAARGAELRQLAEAVAEIRARAEANDAFLAAWPEQSTRQRDALAQAQRESEERRRELAAAEQQLAAARDEEAREYARRAVARAADHLSVTELKVAHAAEELAGLERAAAALPAETTELEERAAVLAGRAEAIPAPAGDLVEWASRARAELFVETSHIDTQRERLIREANELASMLTGEATYGSTAAQALARAEAHWTSSPGQVSESR